MANVLRLGVSPLLSRPIGHGSLSSAQASVNGVTVPRQTTPGRNASKPAPATRSVPRTSRGHTRDVLIGRAAIARPVTFPPPVSPTSDTESGDNTSS